MNFEWIGYLAGVLSTCVSIPQIVKIIRTRNVQDISLLSFSILFVQAGLWSIYGALNGIMPIMIFTGLNSFFSLIVVILKLVFGRDKK